MDERKAIFGSSLGIPSNRDGLSPHETRRREAQLRRILFATKFGTDNNNVVQIPPYTESDFNGKPDGLQIPHSFQSLQDSFQEVYSDPHTPAEAATGSWVMAKTSTNFFVLSLFAQSGRRVEVSTDGTMNHFPFCQPHVNSRPTIEFGRVDGTSFNSQTKASYGREDGLLVGALGLVEDCRRFSSSTGATVLPFGTFQPDEVDKTKLSIEPVDPPALQGSINQAASKLTLKEVQICWKKLVSNDTKVEDLIPAVFKESQTPQAAKVAAGMCILLNGIHLRYGGLKNIHCWAKLYRRLFAQLDNDALRMNNRDNISARDLDVQSPNDLCHLTFLLFDLVITKECSLGIVDGALRTLVARMIATWRQQHRPMSLKYSTECYVDALDIVSQTISVDVLNIKAPREELESKHGKLLQTRSLNINKNANAAAPRGIIESLVSFLKILSTTGNNAAAAKLDVTKAISISVLNQAQREMRNSAIDHLYNNPDIHTEVKPKEDKNEWRENLIGQRLTDSLNNFKFPGTYYCATRIFCNVALMSLKPTSATILERFVKRNGQAYKSNFEGFKVLPPKKTGKRKKSGDSNEGHPENRVHGFFPRSIERSPEWNMYWDTWNINIYRPASLIVELWLSCLEPKNTESGGGRLKSIKKIAEKITTLHVVPQILQLYNEHGPCVSLPSDLKTKMPNFSCYMAEATEQLGGNLAVLLCLISFSCARSMCIGQAPNNLGIPRDGEAASRNISFFAKDDDFVLESFRKKALLANKFDGLDPSFFFNATESACLSELTAFLLKNDDNNETEKFKADFDATLISFPLPEVLNFLKGANGMKLEKLVDDWVLDEANKKETAVNLGIIQGEMTSPDQEEQEGGHDEAPEQSPAHLDTEESGEDRTPISENRGNEESESNKLLTAPASHSSQSMDDLFATYIQKQEKADQNNKENTTLDDDVANQFKRMSRHPTLGFKRQLRDTVKRLVTERREYIHFVEDQITLLEAASERLGSSIEADTEAVDQSNRFPKKKKRKRGLFERPANRIHLNPFHLDEASEADPA